MGGLLTNPPKNSDLTTDASLALRFCGELDGIIAILSGMSNLIQIKKILIVWKIFNLYQMKKNLTVAYKQGDSLGCIDFDQYKDIKPHGISLTSQLKTYNSCITQA